MTALTSDRNTPTAIGDARQGGVATGQKIFAGALVQLREWIAPRHVHNLKAHKFTIANRKFESTVAIQRDHISDDKLGVPLPIRRRLPLKNETYPAAYCPPDILPSRMS